MKAMVTCILTIGFMACGGSSGGNLSLSFSVPTTASGALTTSSALTTTADAAGLRMEDNSANVVVVTLAEVVLREVEFEKVDAPDCIEESDCEKVEVGPLLVQLPLDGGTELVVEATLSADTYDEVEFDIHKLEGEADQVILADRPDLDKTSVHVKGTYNGAPFIYKSELNEEQEIPLNPPLVVESSSANVSATLSVDLATWFVDGAGNLVNPNDGNRDGIHENLVRDNIRGSIARDD